MAKKNEITEYLNEVGLTELEMNHLFEELADTNNLVKNLIKQNINWKSLDISVIKQIPNQKEKDIKALKDQNMLTKEIIKKEEEKNNYNENFEEIMFCKILNKEKLSEYELSKLLDYEFESIEGSFNRWTQNIQTIIKLCDEFFAIEWERGLTEIQYDIFFNQPYEVEKYQYKKTITVTEWKKIKER